MTRSLRLRVFLITWPLVVVAVIGVAWTFARWVEVELQATMTQDTMVGTSGPLELADSVAAGVFRRGDAADSASLVDLAATLDIEGGIIVLGRDATVLASTVPAVRLVDPPATPGGLAGFELEQDDGTVRTVERLDLAGLPVESGGALVGSVYLVGEGRDTARPEETRATVRSDLRRLLLAVVVLSSLAAALAAILVAGPLVAQVTRLATAASSVARGELGVEVPEGVPDELGRLERSFNAMSRSLERAEAMKRRVVSDAAHELRTPLTNVVALLESVHDGVRPADGETLELLRREAGLLVTLVDDLQELTLVESGQIDFDLEVLAAREVAHAAARAAKASAPDRDWRLPDREGGPTVRADRRRLAQVLAALLRNAVEHTRPGDPIAVEVGVRAGFVEVAVRDGGVGIPAEHVEHIWERFYRVDPSRDRASGGMGLGLAIVRHLVEGMGGEVDVTSREGRGSRFVVRLPVA